jgi:hypothetical protein
MRTSLLPALLPLLAALLPGCADDTPLWRVQADRISDRNCERMYTCMSAEQLQTGRDGGLPLGNNEAECRENYRELTAGKTAPCSVGQTYDADRAQACIEALDTLTCESFLLEPSGPGDCRTLCR